MTASVVEQPKTQTPSKVEQAAKKIADLVEERFEKFPSFTFAKTHYRLTSPEGRAIIKQHVTKSLQSLPLTDLDIALLNDDSSPALPAVAGDIKMKELPPQATPAETATPGSTAAQTTTISSQSTVLEAPRPYMTAIFTGSSVEATGLSQVYFAAMSTRSATFVWNAASQITGTAADAIASKIKSDNILASSVEKLHAVDVSVCMKDALNESKLGPKVIAVAVQRALLPYYSDQQLEDALSQLHNDKAPFTVFLRKNSNLLSGIIGRDTHSWTEAVAHIKAEAQSRLDKLAPVQIESASTATATTTSQAVTGAADQARQILLKGIVNYSGSLFSSSEAPAPK